MLLLFFKIFLYKLKQSLVQVIFYYFEGTRDEASKFKLCLVIEKENNGAIKCRQLNLQWFWRDVFGKESNWILKKDNEESMIYILEIDEK